MTDADLSLLPVFLPLIGAGFALLSKSLPKGRGARALELAGAGIGLILPWAALAALHGAALAGGISFSMGGWDGRLGIGYRFDGSTWLLDALTFACSGAAYLYSIGSGPRGPAFTAVYLIQVSALAATAGVTDFFNLFVCLEILGITSYVLISRKESGTSFLASFNYLVVSSAAMCFYLFGLYGLYRIAGSLSYAGVAEALSSADPATSKVAGIATACVALAILLRVALFPVHGWLPDAHAAAPHAVSAILSGVAIKIPLFALLRILAYLPAGPRASELLGAVGAATAILAVLAALCQKDVKRLLAYHSISQIGYVAAVFGVLSLDAFSAAYLHALFHGLFKALLFLSVGTVADAAGTRNVYDLRRAASSLAAAGDRRGLTFIAFSVGVLSICAIPPFNGFASKNALMDAVGGGWRYWILFAAGIGTAASMAKLSAIFLPSKGAELRGTDFSVRPSMKLSVALLAAGCLLTGVAAPFLFGGIRALLSSSALPIAAAPLTEPPAAAHQFYGQAALFKTAAVSAAGLLLAFLALTPAGRRAASAARGSGAAHSAHLISFCLALGLLAAYFVFF